MTNIKQLFKQFIIESHYSFQLSSLIFSSLIVSCEFNFKTIIFFLSLSFINQFKNNFFFIFISKLNRKHLNKQITQTEKEREQNFKCSIFLFNKSSLALFFFFFSCIIEIMQQFKNRKKKSLIASIKKKQEREEK